ncbi:DNA translocase FtsK, partial [Methylobacterium iners]|uniref:DNA translocase FtsK n=1 Tax=Methylobacterium iners TaxID=418707 RepID=UPI001EE3994F
MRSLRRSASPYDTYLDSVRPFIAKRMTELGGLVLFAGATALTVALATWSIEDPSLNHATLQPAHNVLGVPGAIVSDLAMQLLGLGALAFALPPAFWGVQLIRTRELPRGGLRIALWVIGFFAASAVASALPPTARWPLPTGLGGVAGDALMQAARTLVGVIVPPASALVGFAFAGIAILSLTGACRAGAGDDAEDDAPAHRHDARRDEREDADGPGLGLVSLGAVAQLLISGRNRLTGRIESWRAERAAADLVYAGNSPALAARRAFAAEDDAPWASAPRPAPAFDGRREPVFDREAAPPLVQRRAAPVLHDDEPDDGGPEDGMLPDPEPEAPARVSRVSAPPPPPAPVRRAALVEAYAPDDYAHPALELLAAPKPPAPGSQISADALEQNATLLEATLSDFGVRGDILAVRPGPVVTLYELEPAPGTKSSRVISLADDIARSMSAVSARVAVVQGRNAIGIELPNAKRETVFLRELLASAEFSETKHSLALCLGKN